MLDNFRLSQGGIQPNEIGEHSGLSLQWSAGAPRGERRPQGDIVVIWNRRKVLLRKRREVRRGYGPQLCPPLGSRVLSSRGDSGELSHYFQTVIDRPGFHYLAVSNPVKGGSRKAKWFAGWTCAHKLAFVRPGRDPARGNRVAFNDHVFLRDLEVREGGVQHRD